MTPHQRKRVRKAIFPVAGLGTRFLPATKAMPKEMLTVVDRPVIQHVVDEAKAAGIEHFIFVTGRNKGVIEDHFDSQFELERTLAERGKEKELEQLFAAQVAQSDTLRSLTQQLAQLQGKLRFVHLQAHVEMKRLLSPEQVEAYDALRGYTAGAGAAPHTGHRHHY